MTHVSPPASTMVALADSFLRVGRGEHVVIDCGDRPVAALIPMEDLELLDRLIWEEEHRLDIEAVRQVRADLASGKTGTVPWAEVEARLDSLWPRWKLALIPSRPESHAS